VASKANAVNVATAAKSLDIPVSRVVASFQA
jgi:hypothetical protein